MKKLRKLNPDKEYIPFALLASDKVWAELEKKFGTKYIKTNTTTTDEETT